MSQRPIPLLGAFLAVIGSFGALGLILVGLLRFELPLSMGVALPPLAALILAALLTLRWPSGSWKWGLWASSGIWLYFGSVFIALWVNGEIDVVPLVEVVASPLCGCLGALLVLRLSATGEPSTG